MPAAPFLVDFVIGGTQKGGTSALAHFLGQHPEIVMPKWKEPHFFDAPDFPDADFAELNRRYRKYFPKEMPDDSPCRIVGETTPIYMYLPEVPARVRRYNPAMKWILLLREPVSRALSHYAMQRERKWERLPLAWALRAEPFRLWRARRTRAWKTALRTFSYVERGFYCEQIARIQAHFPAEQILILTSEELRRQHDQTLQRVYAFLGVENRAFMARAEAVFSAAQPLNVSPKIRVRLAARYAGEIQRVEKLLGRPLDEWRNANARA